MADTQHATLTVIGDWRIEVAVDGKLVALDLAPATLMRVRDEKHQPLAEYRPTNASWDRGEPLAWTAAEACGAQYRLVEASLVVKRAPGDALPYVEGGDYAAEKSWGQIGRLAGGAIAPEAAVWVDYDSGVDRIDSVIADPAGRVSVRHGTPHQATPKQPELRHGERRIANIWLPGLLAKLAPDNLYPILEPTYPEPQPSVHPVAEKLLPKTWAKLQGEGELHILAWGDSVTCLPATGAEKRYQHLFVAALRQKYPKAKIKLTTLGWGGRTTDAYLSEPKGSAYNFAEKVLGAKADLIISEFVNDAFMNQQQVQEKYGSILRQFQANGSEWVIIAPHFVRPDGMGQNTVRIESDPRPYVAGLREFCAKDSIPLADTPKRWGHLVKEGIPYTTLFLNTINHPDERGHEMFAKALMELF